MLLTNVQDMCHPWHSVNQEDHGVVLEIDCPFLWLTFQYNDIRWRGRRIFPSFDRRKTNLLRLCLAVELRVQFWKIGSIIKPLIYPCSNWHFPRFKSRSITLSHSKSLLSPLQGALQRPSINRQSHPDNTILIDFLSSIQPGVEDFPVPPSLLVLNIFSVSLPQHLRSWVKPRFCFPVSLALTLTQWIPQTNLLGKRSALDIFCNS